MNENLRELQSTRAALLDQLEKLVDTAEKEDRSLTAEENEQFQRIRSEVENLNERIDRITSVVDLIREAEARGTINRQAEIGMSKKDLAQYSLVRAIRAAATNNWQEAQLELEASRAVAQRLGKDPQGFFVPMDVLHEKRALVVGDPASGGYTVSTDLLASSMVELLRTRLVTSRVGTTVLTDLVGNVAIPRQVGGATAYWVTENGAVTESQQQFAQILMSPKTVGAFTEYSRLLLLQSSLDVERFVRNDLTRTLATAIDYVALNGDSTADQPEGIANTTGIGLVVGGTDGAAPTWAHIVQLETEVAIQNADEGQLAYITSPKVRGYLKTVEKFTGTGMTIWSDNNIPLNGYRALVSTQVRDDITKGVGTNLSQIFFGNWQDLMIGMWGTLDILVDRYTNSATGAVRVVALQDTDVAVRHPQSFALMNDADAN